MQRQRQHRVRRAKEKALQIEQQLDKVLSRSHSSMPHKSFRVLRLYKMPASRQIVSDKTNTSTHTHKGSKCVP